MALNENVGVYEPGADITCTAGVPVIGKRFVAITGDRSQGNFAVTGTAGGPAAVGNITIGPATAGGRSFGVSKYDQPTVGGKVGVTRGAHRVTYVTAGANLGFFQEVEAGAGGVAVAHNTGVALGYAVTSATSGADAEISLY